MAIGQSSDFMLTHQLATIVGSQHVSLHEPTSQTTDLWPIAFKEAAITLLGARPVIRVSPGTPAEVAAVLGVCSRSSTPVTTYGGGSGVTGSAIPTAGGVLLDLIRLKSIRSIDQENLLVTADAGLIGGELEKHLGGLGFTLGFYPQSLEISTIGGWIASGAIGTYSGRYGGIEDLLAGLEVVLADGMMVTTPIMSRWALGPNLGQLFVGSEGTLGVITGATVRMFRLPERRIPRALRFSRLADGMQAMQTIAQKGLRPAVARLYDELESWNLRYLVSRFERGCLLLLVFEGPQDLAELEQDLAVQICLVKGAVDLGRKPAEQWDTERLRPPESFPTLREPGTTGDYLDIQALWDHVLNAYQAVRQALLQHCTRVSGYFTHPTPQGCAIYFAITINATDDAEAVQRYQRAWSAAMEAAQVHGAAIAHNRGIGLVRAPWFATALGDAWPLWERMKDSFDPLGILNPGKLGNTHQEPDL